MNSGIKLIRYLYFTIILTVSSSLYIIWLTSIDKEYKYAWVHKFVTKIVTTNVFIAICTVFLLLILILSFKCIQKLITLWVYKNQDTKKRRVIAISSISTIVLIYCILSGTFYGLFVNETLINGSQIDFNNSLEILMKIHLIDNDSIKRIVLFTIINYFLFIPIIKIFRFMLRREIIADIYCHDGSCFYKKHLINFNLDGNLLVGDSSDLWESNKLLISKSVVLRIEFTNVDYIFGRVPEASYLVLPKDFTDEEKKMAATMK